MEFKTMVKQFISTSVQIPLLSRAAFSYYERRPRSDFPGFDREHPYDRLHGVSTSGTVPGFVLGPGTTAYGAAQPSIIRRAIAEIPNPKGCHFLDLGCGKGRPLLIATEFGFPSITGVEFARGLARVAQRNIAIISRAYPDRTRINLVIGDALAYRLPPEKLVIFIYNPFDRPRMVQLLANIEASLLGAPRDLYIICYNPVWADVLDGSAALERRYAAQIPYDPGEIGYGPQESDAVIIWQNRGNLNPRPPGDPEAPIRIVVPGLLAEIARQT